MLQPAGLLFFSNFSSFRAVLTGALGPARLTGPSADEWGTRVGIELLSPPMGVWGR